MDRDIVIRINFFTGADYAFAHLDVLREEFRFFTEIENCENEDDGDENKWEKLEPGISDIIPSSDGFGSDEVVANVLNRLSNRADKKDFRGDGRSFGDHRNWIDNRSSIEEGLGKYIPNRGDVTVANIDCAEKKRNAERQDVNFKERKRDKQPVPTRLNAVN